MHHRSCNKLLVLKFDYKSTELENNEHCAFKSLDNKQGYTVGGHITIQNRGFPYYDTQANYVLLSVQLTQTIGFNSLLEKINTPGKTHERKMSAYPRT